MRDESATPPVQPEAEAATAPVVDLGDRPRLDPGVALCLSGGGYRAMVFHLGALWRLNDAGLLRDLRRISSVSGGSITAALLGLKWKRLGFDTEGVARSFETEVVDPIRALARRTIDVGAVLRGLLLPGTIANRVASAYDRHLFGGATLQDLPDDDEGPRFVINATSVQTGVLWRFMKPYMSDYLVGRVDRPRVLLALAVAASSAFPPLLSPAILRLDPSDFSRERRGPLGVEPYTRRAVLTDGGVYDNLGLETAWKRFRTVLVSDAGGRMTAQERPARGWFRHTRRVLDVVDHQVRSLRKRQLIASYQAPPGESLHREGAYWGIRTDIADYHRSQPDLNLPLDCPHARTLALAGVPTRLARLDEATQERLINWGYAVCDAALRAYYRTDLPAPTSFPYPNHPV